MVVAGPENRLSFIFFSDLYLMIGIGQVKLSKMSNLAQSIQ